MRRSLVPAGVLQGFLEGGLGSGDGVGRGQGLRLGCGQEAGGFLRLLLDAGQSLAQIVRRLRLFVAVSVVVVVGGLGQAGGAQRAVPLPLAGPLFLGDFRVAAGADGRHQGVEERLGQCCFLGGLHGLGEAVPLFLEGVVAQTGRRERALRLAGRGRGGGQRPVGGAQVDGSLSLFGQRVKAGLFGLQLPGELAQLRAACLSVGGGPLPGRGQLGGHHLLGDRCRDHGRRPRGAQEQLQQPGGQRIPRLVAQQVSQALAVDVQAAGVGGPGQLSGDR
ncbi:hypothetical protein ACPCK2_33555 [Streptomyces pseudogriseolus]|uniref:hypothetical protein n=1 Tax=Streptomyces pseudogriseolus TaxID=36817 RepID=UPI003FA2C0ED